MKNISMETQYLVAAIAALSAVIGVLYRSLLAKNKIQDDKLAACERDREALNGKVFQLATGQTEIYKSLYEAGISTKQK